jgi:hypothetical protein
MPIPYSHLFTPILFLFSAPALPFFFSFFISFFPLLFSALAHPSPDRRRNIYRPKKSPSPAIFLSPLSPSVSGTPMRRNIYSPKKYLRLRHSLSPLSPAVHISRDPVAGRPSPPSSSEDCRREGRERVPEMERERSCRRGRKRKKNYDFRREGRERVPEMEIERVRGCRRGRISESNN